MGYKLIALDVDGTILTSRRTIAEPTRRAVQRAMREGLRVTLATGRAFPSALSIARQLGLAGTPLVTHDGAYVADPVTGAVLHHDPIPVQLAAQAAGELQEAGLTVSVLYPDLLVSNTRVRNLSWRLLHPRYWSLVGLLVKEAMVYRHLYGGDLGEYVKRRGDDPPKFYVEGSAGSIRRAYETLSARFDGALRFTPAGSEAMEVTAAGVSKATGLQALSAALGIDPSEVVGIGDNYNDAEMIRTAGLGVAMGNAPEPVRSLARVVTRTNDEHGVAYAIEQYVLDR